MNLCHCCLECVVGDGGGGDGDESDDALGNLHLRLQHHFHLWWWWYLEDRSWSGPGDLLLEEWKGYLIWEGMNQNHHAQSL